MGCQPSAIHFPPTLSALNRTSSLSNSLFRPLLRSPPSVFMTFVLLFLSHHSTPTFFFRFFLSSFIFLLLLFKSK